MNIRIIAKGAIVFLLLLLLGTAYWIRTRFKSDPADIIWTEVHQSIDGFGGSTADFVASLTPAQADFFFTPKGIGLTILRTQIIPDRATCDAEFLEGGCSDSNGQILNGELRSARMAVTRGAIVFSTPWSPPGFYKTNGSFTNGGSLLPNFYPDWAKKIATYVSMMNHNGVPIYAVSVQNEPELSTEYGSCVYTSQQIHDFVPYLQSALNSVGAQSTKIMIAEQTSWAIDRTAATMSDPKVAPAVGIIAAHGYGGTMRPFDTGSARLWQTEGSTLSPRYDGSMRDGISWAHSIHNFLTVANVNAWVSWFLTNMPDQGEGTDNSALTDIHGNYAKRTFVLGQWSKFVRPGWSRIGVNYSGPLQISAFKEPHGRSFAIVAVNSGTNPVRQAFSLNGFDSKAVTPWITSESLSLAPQTPIPMNGGGFTIDLPPLSVTTLSGESAAASR